MSEILIIFIEFLIIIILCLVIRGYVRERRAARDEVSKQFMDAGYQQAQHTNHILKQVTAIRLKLSQELHRDNFKKNKIVKETCAKFADELINSIK